ncbi:unnamed protein product, partial [Closterium sp. NIES-54]
PSLQQQIKLTGMSRTWTELRRKPYLFRIALWTSPWTTTTLAKVSTPKPTSTLLTSVTLHPNQSTPTSPNAWDQISYRIQKREMKQLIPRMQISPATHSGLQILGLVTAIHGAALP